MNPNLLFYRQLLCGSLGGLDNYAERAMVRRLILRIDAILDASPVEPKVEAQYWREQYTHIVRILLIIIVLMFVIAWFRGLI